MKQNKVLSIKIGIFFIFLVTILFFFFMHFSQKPMNDPLHNNIFKEGDIIFVSGTSWRASILRAYGNPDYTHVGLVVKKKKQFFILQAIPEYNGVGNESGVVLTPLKYFFLDVASYSILRHPDYIINRHIDDYLGREFDDKLDRYDSEKIYCTELIDDLLYDNNITAVPKDIESLWPEVLVLHLYNIGYIKINNFK